MHASLEPQRPRLQDLVQNGKLGERALRAPPVGLAQREDPALVLDVRPVRAGRDAQQAGVRRALPDLGGEQVPAEPEERAVRAPGARTLNGTCV